mgnify:FL=1
MKNISIDNWLDEYKPLENVNDVGYVFSIDDTNYEFNTYGEDLEKIKSLWKTDPLKVWTLLEVDDVHYIVNGFLYANRVSYLITEKNAAINEDYEIIVEF